jgi:signal transduction histidine kinase
MDARDREEMPPAREGGLWQAARRWLVTHTFVPPRLSGIWAHPAIGYLVAVLLQAITVTAVTGLVRLFPSFQFQESLVILAVLVVALNWGVGPSLLATLVGGLLLLFLLRPPVFSLTLARLEDALDLLVYLAVGCAVSLLTSQVQRARRSAERVRRRLDTIQQAMTDAVLVYDDKGQLVLWNAAAEQLLPLQQTDDTSHALAERSESLLLRDERGQPLPYDEWPVQRILNSEVLTGSHAVDVLVHLADGRDVLVNFSGAPIRDADGRVISAVTIGRDVTERRRLEASERRLHAETQARQTLLQLILDALPSSVYLVRGHDARLVLANRAAAEIWGASWPPGQPMAEFLAKNGIRIMDMQGQPLAPEQLATLRSLVQGETVLGHQEIIRRPDATRLPVLVNAVALGMQHLTVLPANETGGAAEAPESTEPVALVAHQDVTALKEAEALKDEFLSLVAHELRHPIAGLIGLVETLLQDERSGTVQLTAWQQEALQGIDQATFHLVRLTDALLDAARLQAGRLELVREPTDLVALCRRVVARFQRTAPGRRLSFETPLDHLVAQVDAERIEQVLDNLLSNALKYSPEDGPIQVTLHELVEAHIAELSVSDRGIGIPARQQARIFERFERADNSRAYGIGGTGLGLYLSRALIEQHGGRIWFESIEGQGSTFFIALPLPSEAAPGRL